MISTFRSAEKTAVLREVRTVNDVQRWLDQGDAHEHEIGRTPSEVVGAMRQGFRPMLVTTGSGKPIGTAVVDTSDGGVTAVLHGIGFEPQIMRRLNGWASRHGLDLIPDPASQGAARLFSAIPSQSQGPVAGPARIGA